MRNNEEKNRPTRSTGEARLLLSALNHVQNFGSFQQPVRGSKNAHLPEPDSISIGFDEPLSDEGDGRGAWSEIDAAERKSARRRKWIHAFAAVGAIVVMLFILFTLWLDNYIKQHEEALRMVPPHIAEQHPEQ